MNIEDFVAETLNQILAGCRKAREAQREFSSDGSRINPHVMLNQSSPSAHIAVTVADDKTKSGGALAVLGPLA